MVGPMVWIWLDMVGYTHHPIKALLYVLVYKQILSYVFFLDQKEKENSNMYEWGGGQAHPSLEYISGLIMILDVVWLDLVGYTQNSVHFALVVWVPRLQQRKLILAKK